MISQRRAPTPPQPLHPNALPTGLLGGPSVLPFPDQARRLALMISRLWELARTWQPWLISGELGLKREPVVQEVYATALSRRPKGYHTISRRRCREFHRRPLPSLHKRRVSSSGAGIRTDPACHAPRLA